MIPHRARVIGLIGPVIVLAIGTRAGADPLLYTVTALSNRAPATPSIAGISNAYLNDLGQVAGSYLSSPSTVVGFQYESATGKVSTFPAPSSSTPTTALDRSMTIIDGLNNSGQMIGYQIHSGRTDTTGFLDSNGQISTLPGTPTTINNNGQVAGVVGYVNGQMTDQSPYSPPYATSHTYIDTNGAIKDLGANATVYALNDAGQATGSLDTGAKITVGGGGAAPHVLFYDGQTSKDLGTLGGQFGYGYSINNHGDIVGESQTPTLALHAFMAQQAGKLIDLGTLPGDHNSSAEAINNNGQVVGYSGDSFLTGHAFLYQNGMMIDLNKLLAPNSGVTLNYAAAINDAGQILAVGSTPGDDWRRLYLLTPVGEPQPVPPSTLIAPAPEPSTLVIFAMASIGWAARRHVRRRRAAMNPLRVRTPIAG